MGIPKIKKVKVAAGIYWIEIEDADLFVLCGCPADAIKHLKKRGLVEDITENGVKYESGPNAILLSETTIQNGSFANLTEFPVLQMLYLQGMIIPNHPNNTGVKPMLVGTEEQVNSQLNYIYRGNYGLITKEEMLDAGVTKEMAEDLMNIKLYFSFGKISQPDQFLDKRIIDKGQVELRNGVKLQRTGFNQYQFEFEGEMMDVDLNLKTDEKYEAPYRLSYHLLPREYFAVIHSGEGDGWDINRPCMSSILMFQGKIYLIDAGPNIITSLNYLGISVNEIEGIFHTHAHDDHFAGLTTLARSDHRFKYYSTKLVRTAVSKKLCALMNVSEESFTSFFDIHDLDFNMWNNIAGLEVQPVYSPHPVETNIFFFRTKWNQTYKSYAHLADTVSFEILKKITDTGKLSEGWFNKIHTTYLTPTDLKKIDIGGGLIHGMAKDYLSDQSKKIVLAHTSRPLTLDERQIGSSAAFGMMDVLIPNQKNYLLDSAHKHLRFYFPEAPEHDINYLLNHPVEQINAGTILFKKGRKVDRIYLLLTGSVGFTDSKVAGIQNFAAGSLIGFYSGFLGTKAAETYWAASNINVLSIPSDSYNEFISKNSLYDDLLKMEERILFLEDTWLFGEIVSFPIMMKLAKEMQETTLKVGERIPILSDDHIYLVKDGKADLTLNDQVICSLHQDEFFGGDSRLLGQIQSMEAVITEDMNAFKISAKTAFEIPIVYWKLLETYEKRLRKL